MSIPEREADSSRSRRRRHTAAGASRFPASTITCRGSGERVGFSEVAFGGFASVPDSPAEERIFVLAEIDSVVAKRSASPIRRSAQRSRRARTSAQEDQCDQKRHRVVRKEENVQAFHRFNLYDRFSSIVEISMRIEPSEKQPISLEHYSVGSIQKNRKCIVSSLRDRKESGYTGGNLKRGRKWLQVFMLLLCLGATLQAMDRKGAAEVNRIRQACGMVPLKNDVRLAKAAYRHAKYLGRLRAKGHTEHPGNPYFSGRTPFERFVKAGYPTRAGVENISYGDRNYRESVRVLMSTVYHRLAFLDFRIDTMGSSEYGNRRGRIYVYDMAPSTVAALCLRPKKPASRRYLTGLCSQKRRRIDAKEFFQALRSIERRSASLIVYPYPGMMNTPLRYIRETPDPLSDLYGAGFPISAAFNPAFYRKVRVERFRLYDAAGGRIAARLLSAKRDPHRKLSAGTFILVPLKALKAHTEYRVELQAEADGRPLAKSWHFRTGSK